MDPPPSRSLRPQNGRGQNSNNSRRLRVDMDPLPLPHQRRRRARRRVIPPGPGGIRHRSRRASSTLAARSLASLPMGGRNLGAVLRAAVVGDLLHSPRTARAPSRQEVVGARLRHFVPAWEELTTNQFILRIVTQGLRLEFEVEPPLLEGLRPFSLPRAEA